MRLFTKRKDDFDYNLERSCLTCGTSFQGRYCSRCGEKVVDQQERSVKVFLSDLLNAFTFLDGKFPKSVKSILLKPGKLTEDFVRGIRMPYMKPVSLFFVGNFLYFLLPSPEVFNTRLSAQLHSGPFQQITKSMVQPKIEALAISYQEFEVLYNTESASWAKLLIVLVVILFSGLTTIVNYSKSRFYADHLTLAFEFISFVLFYPVMLLYAFLYLLYWVGLPLGYDLSWLFSNDPLHLIIVFVSWVLYFLLRAEMQFYKATWGKALLKSLTLFAGLIGIVLVYRFVLFLVTIASL